MSWPAAMMGTRSFSGHVIALSCRKVIGLAEGPTAPGLYHAYGSGVAKAVRCGRDPRRVGGQIVRRAAQGSEQVVGEVVAEALADDHAHDRLVGRGLGHGVGGYLPT